MDQICERKEGENKGIRQTSKLSFVFQSSQSAIDVFSVQEKENGVNGPFHRGKESHPIPFPKKL